jgi:hypothetical protein
MLELAQEYGRDLLDIIKSEENINKKAIGQLTS